MVVMVNVGCMYVRSTIDHRISLFQCSQLKILWDAS